MNSHTLSEHRESSGAPLTGLESTLAALEARIERLEQVAELLEDRFGVAVDEPGLR